MTTPPEDGAKQDKFDEFTPEGEALGYISLDQATVLAIQYAQDNPGEYGRRFRSRNMVWEVLSAEEGEDYYHIRLSYRPAGRFSGEPGVELFTVDKAGPITLRQVLAEPQPKRSLVLPIAVVVVVTVVVAIGVVLTLVRAGGGSSRDGPAVQLSPQGSFGVTPSPRTKPSAAPAAPARREGSVPAAPRVGVVPAAPAPRGAPVAPRPAAPSGIPAPVPTARRVGIVPAATPSAPLAPSVPPARPAAPVQALPTMPLTTLSFQVVDAEYSLALDRIIMVSDNPDRLHIYDPVTGTDTAVDLPLAPSAVSVGPDGLFAAVGHNAWVSYVDLQSAALLKTVAVSTDVLDVVLAGNGYAYAFPRKDQWESIRSVNLETGEETLSKSNAIYAGTLAKLHPSGNAIYGADNGISPSDIEKYDISSGTAKSLYDSPYHGDHQMCGDLWISQDGQRIFTRCGNVFRSSNIEEQDMTYNGSLGELGRVRHLTHSAALDKVLVIPGASLILEALRKVGIKQSELRCSPLFDHEGRIYSKRQAQIASDQCPPRDDPDSEVQVYDYQFLALETNIKLPNFEAGGRSFAAYGRFVFASEDGRRIFVVVQADNDSWAHLPLTVPVGVGVFAVVSLTTADFLLLPDLPTHEPAPEPTLEYVASSDPGTSAGATPTPDPNRGPVPAPSPDANGNILYGVNAADDGLSAIDAATGRVTYIGPLDRAPDKLVVPVAMAVRPSDGKLFVSDGQAGLLTVDACTGLATRIGPEIAGLGALAFAPDGTLFGGDMTLRQIDPATGAMIEIGQIGPGLRVSAMDFSPAGVLYGVELRRADQTPRLATIDIATGKATVIGTLNEDVGTIGSISFDARGVLIASAFGGPRSGVLFDIDPRNAAVSNVRPTARRSPSSRSGMATPKSTS